MCLLLEPSGRLWLVDWTHRWLAPGWADWVRLAPDVAASGFDPEAVLRHSAWTDADHHGVNVMLAGLAGRCWREGHRRCMEIVAIHSANSVHYDLGNFTEVVQRRALLAAREIVRKPTVFSTRARAAVMNWRGSIRPM